jgi:hypothetical protein
MDAMLQVQPGDYGDVATRQSPPKLDVVLEAVFQPTRLDSCACYSRRTLIDSRVARVSLVLTAAFDRPDLIAHLTGFFAARPKAHSEAPSFKSFTNNVVP